ncbi:unnamed protein product [Prorocentrum cordatum]|uniref:Uncharacterized protein n=1 Tax=Prorocentrum cordatum TaxID=2364126 RepID=A0ABN9W6D9_9DINO|nr:unnamed protein product [Polarella glacialis]
MMASATPGLTLLMHRLLLAEVHRSPMGFSLDDIVLLSLGPAHTDAAGWASLELVQNEALEDIDLSLAKASNSAISYGVTQGRSEGSGAEGRRPRGALAAAASASPCPCQGELHRTGPAAALWTPRAERKAEDVAEAAPATTTAQPDEPEGQDSEAADAAGEDCEEIKVWKGKCHTSTPGESCFSSVDWALKVGLPSHPDWYVGIEADATFEEVQGFLHDHHFQLSCCPTPCKPGALAVSLDDVEGAATDAESEDGDGDGGRAGCRSVDEGDPCYEAVDWAMTVGILQHPEWYEGEGVTLTGDSSFDDFQQFLHDERQMCPAPCRSSTTTVGNTGKGASTRAGTSLTSITTSRSPRSTSSISSSTSSSTSSSSTNGSSSSSSSSSSSRTTTAISDAGSSCKTSVKGDDCYLSVVWAMEHGIKKHADWYPGLSGDSTFEDFQRVLHEKFPAMSRCSLPCSSPAEPAAAQASDERPAKVLEAAPRSIQDSQVIVAAEEEMNKSVLALASGGVIKNSSSAAKNSSAKHSSAAKNSSTAKNSSAAKATPAIHDAGAVDAPVDPEARCTV